MTSLRGGVGFLSISNSFDVRVLSLGGFASLLDSIRLKEIPSMRWLLTGVSADIQHSLNI